MGNIEPARPWTYADLIASTSGIDAVLDGHSHDTDQVVMKNRDGEEVTRSAVGTKLSCIGYSHISREGEIVETGIWSWPNAESAPLLLNIQNEMRSSTDQALQEIAEKLDTVVACAGPGRIMPWPQETAAPAMLSDKESAKEPE